MAENGTGLTVNSYCNKPGIYIELIYNKKDGNVLHFMIPYKEAISIGTNQETFTPIKDFFAEIERILASVAKTNVFAASAKAAKDIVALATTFFGMNILGKGYQAKAWKNGSHIILNVNLNFYWGMNGKGDAKEEVFNPILTIYQYTIPLASKLSKYSGQMPNSADVFVAWGKDFLSNNNTLKGNKGFQEANEQLNSSISSDIKGNSKTWSIKIGYSKDGKSFDNNTTFFILDNLICTSSNFSFDTSKVDETKYPMKGDLKLTFSTQFIHTTEDLNKKGFFETSLILENDEDINLSLDVENENYSHGMATQGNPNTTSNPKGKVSPSTQNTASPKSSLSGKSTKLGGRK